jgi:hypothetical protein
MQTDEIFVLLLVVSFIAVIAGFALHSRRQAKPGAPLNGDGPPSGG